MKKALSCTLALLMLLGTFSLVLPFFATAESAYLGTVYYIDAEDGNDLNDGKSPTSAWQTLSMVNNMTLQPGDAVLLRSGCTWSGSFLWPKGSGEPGKPITITSYGEGEKPVIKSMYDDELDGLPMTDSAVYLENQSYVTVDGLYIINGTPGTGAQNGVRINMTGGYTTEGNVIKNCVVFGSNVKNWKTSSKSDMSGIQVSATSYSGYINSVLIENNEIYNCKAVGISVNGSVGGCNKDGITNAKSARNVVIRGNFLSNIGKDGIMTNNCYEPLVEYNTCAKAHSYATNSAHVAMWPFATYKALYQFNESYDTQTQGDGQGFDCDYQCYYTTFQYNFSHDNIGGFMLICTEPKDWNGNAAYNVGSTVRYNISQNDNHYVFSMVGATDQTSIYNNVIYSRWNNTNSTHTFWSYTKGAGIFNGRKYADQLKIYNNIFYIDSMGGFDLKDKCTNVEFKNNLSYGRNAGSVPANDDTATTDDGIISSGNLIGKNPRFVDGGRATSRIDCDGYMLYDNSPAIGAGLVVADNGGRDYFGNAVSATTAPNIGAYNGAGVHYDTSKFTFDSKYMALLDFERQDLGTANGQINQLSSPTRCECVLTAAEADIGTGSKQAITITNNTAAAGSSECMFNVYPDDLKTSTGIRFYVKSNGSAAKGTIVFKASNSLSYTKEFKIAPQGGWVTFSWNEKYTGSYEAKVTPEIMRKILGIGFKFKQDAGDSVTVDDIQINVGEADPEYVEPKPTYPAAETILVDNFDSYAVKSYNGGGTYGGPSYGATGQSGVAEYNGSRAVFGTSVSSKSTAIGQYFNYKPTFELLRNKLLTPGVQGIQFDMSSVALDANQLPLNEDDLYKIRDLRDIYNFSIGSSTTLTFKDEEGTEYTSGSFKIEKSKPDANNLVRISFDDLFYQKSSSTPVVKLKDIATPEQMKEWFAGINALNISYTSFGGNVNQTLYFTWYIDNLCVYGNFSPDVDRTTTAPTTPAPTTTTTTTTTTVPTTVPTTITTTTVPTTTIPPTIPTIITTTAPTTTFAPTTTAAPVLRGDCNGDNKRDAKDLLLLRKVLALWKVTYDKQAADCNADNLVNAKDLLLLRQYFADWDVVL